MPAKADLSNKVKYDCHISKNCVFPATSINYKMKIFKLLIMLSCFIPGNVQSEPASKKVELIFSKLIPKGWSFSKDDSSYICTAPKVKFLNPISLPASSAENSTWEEFSWESDFHVVVRITPKLTDTEYAALVKMRSALLESRIHDAGKENDVKINDKSRFGIEQEVHAMITLPYCYSENQTIWISTTDDGLLKTRPKAARDFADALRMALANDFTLYKKER